MGDKLGENFEVQSITFHDTKTQSRTIGQPGWRETPLAYVLLKAKDASVDRIPELQMDLDFYDSLGPVLLPVTTATQIVDALLEPVVDRPVAELELTQTLDARLDNENKEITLELHATGKGLIPPLEKLVKLNIAGFKVKKDDQELSIARVESDASSVNAVSERTWLLTLKPADDAGELLTFKFPEPTDLVAKTAYKQYSDADLEKVDSELALAGLVLNPTPTWPWFAGSAAVLLLLGIGAWRMANRDDGQIVAPVYQVPDVCTPFAVIDLLQRIDAASPKSLGASHRDQLQGTIRELEQIHFAPDATQTNGHGDLQAVARDWVGKVS